MKSISLVLILLLTPLGISSPQSNGSVEGTISRTNGDPISGVRVLLSGFQATTNDEGFFAIPDLPPGVYPVSVERDGYVFAGGANRSVGRLAVEPGARIRGFHIEIVQTGIISGRITNPKGEPFTNGTVQLERISYDGYRRYRERVGLSQQVTVDDRGNFRAFGVRPGHYYLYVDPRIDTLVRTYFPGTEDPSKVVPITVREGEEVSANFQILAGPFRAISGVVTAPSSSAVTRYAVTYISHAADSPPLDDFYYAFDSSRDPPQRELTLGGVGMTSGMYSLFVRGESSTANFYGLVSVIVGDGRLTGVSVPLRRGVDIPGRLTIEGDASSIQLSSDPVNLRSVTAIPFDSSELARRFSQAQTGGGGQAPGGIGRGGGVSPLPAAGPAVFAAPPDSFMIRSIPEGRYAFFPPIQGYGYIKDVRQAGRSILETGLVVGAEQPQPLDVVLSSNGGVVEGVLLNGRKQGMGFLTAVLVPANPLSLRLYKSAITDYSGHFYFRDIAPGEYRLFAWLNAPYNAWTNAAFMNSSSERGTPVTVKENGHVTDVVLNLIPN